VNSPGPEAEAGGGAKEGAGVEAGDDIGDQGAGSGAAGFALAELKMRVNSPGPALAPEVAGGAGALTLGAAGALGGYAPGAGAFGVAALGLANGAFIDRNMAVKLPGSLPPAGAAEGAGAGGAENATGSGRFSGATAGKAGGVCPEAAIFSIGTGLNTFASSSDGRAGGALTVSGVFSACSMRVNSPGAGATGGGADGGAGAG